MAHCITTHNANGEAIFSKLVTQHHEIPVPIGTIKNIWSNREFQMNLSTELDIDQYKQDRIKKFFPGDRRICPQSGAAVCIISMKPSAESAFHRTMTLDTIVVLEGEIEFHLDSGERRVAKVGDTIVQRGTMHKWINVTPGNGWAKWVAFIQAIEEPLKVGSKTLGSEWT